MMSIRSASSMLQTTGGKFLGRHYHGAESTILSTMLPTHLSSSSTTANPSTTSIGATRHHSSPAYRRFMRKQGVEQGIYVKGKPSGSMAGGIAKVHIGGSPRIPAEKPGTQVPTLAVAEALPNGYSEMDNEPLLAVAEMGNHGARIELLKRHIMSVDKVDYGTAEKTFANIAAKSREGIFMQVLPYEVGIALSITAAIGAWPMVFDETTSLWFNHHFVTMEIPEPSDMDTWLEVGAWTWNWNEPVLGTASFVLLCLQFSR